MMTDMLEIGDLHNLHVDGVPRRALPCDIAIRLGHALGLDHYDLVCIPAYRQASKQAIN